MDDLGALATIARFELIFFVGALALVVFYKMLAGRIVLKGLLDDAVTKQFSVSRLQMLIVTIVGAAAFLGTVIANPTVLPSSDDLLASENLIWMALLGSQSGYLGTKYISLKSPKTDHGAAEPDGAS